MNAWIALLAALTGYFIGSISFARIVTRIFAPGHDISRLKVDLPDGSAGFETDVVSATTVRLHLGARYGCLTAILDMLKVTIPALTFRLLWPTTYSYLIVATAGTIGHILPLYYGFKGGRGMSPALGGMFVMDPLGVVVTNAVGAVVGILSGDFVLLTGTGIALMIPWIWFRTGDGVQLIYVAGMNVLFWVAMTGELKEYLRLRREGKLKAFSEAPQVRIAGRRDEEITEQLRVSSLLRTIWAGLQRVRLRYKNKETHTQKS